MASPLELLEQRGLKYEELNAAERETLNGWYKALSEKTLSVGDIQDNTRRLIEAVENQLADLKESTSFWSWLFNRKKDIYLKARLKNYLMLYDFLTGPEKARKHIEQSINNIKPK